MTLPYSVYILKCSNGQFYTGFSANLDQRMKAHNRGEVQLIHVSNFKDKQKAYDFERYLKSGSGIAFRNKRLL